MSRRTVSASPTKTSPIFIRGYLSHPNYAVVAGEIAVPPLVLGLPMLAVIFTILNAAVLMIRISVENRALAASGELTAHERKHLHRAMRRALHTDGEFI
jgi:hypothetical protein